MTMQDGGETRDYAEMARALAEGRLDPSGFDHRAHLGVAYEMLTRHEVFEAMAIYARGLRQVTEQAGVPEKFNATVTLAFLSLAAQRIAQQGCVDVEQFLRDNSDLLTSGVLGQYYASDQLGSDLARRVPLLPQRGE